MSRPLGFIAVLVVLLGALILGSVASAATWTPGAPTVDAISGAPWNPAQGVPSFDGSAVPSYPSADLLPTFSFAGQTAAGGSSYTASVDTNTTTTPTTQTITEPNVAVYPGPTNHTEPDPSGYVGTPGPLSGFCPSSETDASNQNEALTYSGNPNTPLGEPASEPLPFSPYYFPQVVSNGNGTLTGYFDWRPKDGDEAVVAATSSDGGLTWTASGEALEQDQSYCPSGDTNDDGNGHPYVANLGGGPDNDLYTLQRAVGDTAGSGLLVHPITSATSSNALGGVPSTESVGVDPNTFATQATTVSSTAVSIPVSTLGGDSTGNTTAVDGDTLPDPTEIVAGTYSVIPPGSSESSGSAPAQITCTGTSGSTGSTASPPTLTGCTSSVSLSITAGADLIQDIATGVATPTTIPYGPQAEAGTTGATIALGSSSAPSYTNTTVAPITGFLLGNNAPVRAYVNGSTVYCVSTNSTPVTKLEDCTTTNPSGVSDATAAPVIADPVDPAYSGDSSGVPQTSGLIAPDGIDGVIPANDDGDWNDYDGDGLTIPANATVVLYTEKLIDYYQVGYLAGTVTTVDSSSDKQNVLTLPLTTSTNLDVGLNPVESESLPATGNFQVYVGYTGATGSGIAPAVGTVAAGSGIVALTCTGWVDDSVNTNLSLTENKDNEGYLETGSSVDLEGCKSSSTDTAGYSDSNGTIADGSYVDGPGAAITPYSVLAKIGEGSTSAKKLFGNNEDYEVIRAAYTTNGTTFTDLGPVSGSDSGAGSTTGAYDDLTDPSQQDSPAGNPSSGGLAANAAVDTSHPLGDAPTSLSAGTVDTTELRWPGARGTLVVNPDGTLGLFLSGAWASDGDSDAFNQTFYAESSNGGVTWSVPSVVESTDYDFSASVAQDNALAAGTYPALGVSAYSSGRAYDPTVVQNANGTLTMVFAGYRVPNPVKPAGGAGIGTDTAAPYIEGATVNGAFETDPAIYRNILTTTLTQTPAALISEWRPAGPGGTANDDYVDIANTGTAALTMTGWTLNFINGDGTKESVSLSGSIPVGGHLLAADSAYSLSAVTAADVKYSLPANYVPEGVQLLNPAGDVVDAVGYSNSAADAGFYEGTPLTPPTSSPTGQYAYVRNYSDGVLVNRESNASDFTLLDTAAADVGNAAYGSPTNGVPGPLDLGSPIVHNAFLQSSLVDPKQPASASPNMTYNPSTGVLDINRTLTNCSGQLTTVTGCANASPGSTQLTVTRLQFRTTMLTTGTILAESSPGATITNDDGTFTMVPLTLAAPAGDTTDAATAADSLGGLNSVLIATSQLPSGGLASGQSINVQFQFQEQSHGAFSFAYNAEDDLEPENVTAAPTTPGAGSVSTDSSAAGGSATSTAPAAATATEGSIGATTATATIGPAAGLSVLKPTSIKVKPKTKSKKVKPKKVKPKTKSKPKAKPRHATAQSRHTRGKRAVSTRRAPHASTSESALKRFAAIHARLRTVEP